jgi:hypothetical protein
MKYFLIAQAVFRSEGHEARAVEYRQSVICAEPEQIPRIPHYTVHCTAGQTFLRREMSKR